MTPATIAPEDTLARHLRRTLVLAWPMILSRVGIVTMHMLDVVVLGRAGAQELADYVLGLAIQDGLIGVTIGLLLGVPVLVARETGRGEDARAGAVWRRGLVFGMGFGAVFALLLQFAEPLYLASGQEPALAARAARVTAVLGLTLPFVAGYYVSASFLEAVHRPGVALVAVLIANAANLGLSVALVFGAGPLPAMGAMGCALATVITFAALFVGTTLYVTRLWPARRRYGIGMRAAAMAPPALEQVRIGLAAGVALGLEVSAFSAMTLLVGRLGTLALAAHGILFQFLAVTFMIAYGIAGATQVRVGNAWGRGDRRGLAMAGWTGLGLAMLLTGLATLVYASFPLSALGVFTDDPAVLAAAAPVMIWVVLATVFDGGQTVVGGACRGRGDTWVPTLLHFSSYWLVMVPVAALLVFRAGQGLAGIYQAIGIASVVSLSLLSLRFLWLSRAAR